MPAQLHNTVAPPGPWSYTQRMPPVRIFTVGGVFYYLQGINMSAIYVTSRYYGVERQIIWDGEHSTRFRSNNHFTSPDMVSRTHLGRRFELTAVIGHWDIVESKISIQPNSIPCE
ncbi:hypothetical protein FRC12_015574 [Ceratobasidium sp. 428]|nr:hypothetical protein FRC12_015574 [Ceratobasidium sp. 428]